MATNDAEAAQTEFDATLADAALRMVANAGKSHGTATAKELAARAHQVVFRALSDDFASEPMTPTQADYLRHLCAQFSDVEFSANATRAQAHALISDLKEQVDDRKPWMRRT